ncbi:MAG: GNAT family N-acetyltransferase [Euryarchaeota archaeon]|nr:GNAT family N-acetyltransferase [Euryarchaeota archaeon]MDE1835688.1 GNAT family N-acetyltransferase [Euryarchaeota archaeon]MDE1880450.1 GNAT family N-acetyltransferase [Euryarchaeota archaeon]MDE2043878.1 GNAT family N-acetyltransferase [Thermoplasmata archaeon]
MSGFPEVKLPIRTERLELRLPRDPDARALSRAGDHPEVSRGTYVPHPFGPDAARRNIRRLRSAAGGRALPLLIVERGTRTPIGLVGLGSVNRRDRSAELFYWVSPDRWGLGLAHEAASAVLGIAFGPLGLHRVSATAHTFNARSLRLLRRLGFRREGRERESRREGRVWHDALRFGLLEREHRRGVALARSHTRAGRPAEGSPVSSRKPS